jgi:general secretion pathway protein J
VTVAERCAGFTLVEVLVALAITAFVSAIAYSGLSTAIIGVEQTRAIADRTYEVNRAWMIISRDLRQFVPRPVRDEFGEPEPALQGGPAARFLLSLTRTGWHNPNALPRSNLQRVNYRLEDGALWRETYPVLDRAGDTAAQEVRLLEGVEYLTIAFLGSLAGAGGADDSLSLETRDWPESWVVDTSTAGASLAPPVAVEIRLQLEDWGEMRRLYALPPL